MDYTSMDVTFDLAGAIFYYVISMMVALARLVPIHLY